MKPYYEGFNWREGRRSGFSSIEGKAWEDPGCPLQTLASPASAPPTSWYMKHYAGHQEAWLTDFAAAYDKMSSNGYGAGSLALVEAALEATECTSQLELDYSQCWAQGDGAAAAQVRVNTQVGAFNKEKVKVLPNSITLPLYSLHTGRDRERDGRPGGGAGPGLGAATNGGQGGG